LEALLTKYKREKMEDPVNPQAAHEIPKKKPFTKCAHERER
jgi:hypothetical protein